MKISSAVRAALVVLTAFAGAALPSVALADDGSVSLVIYKAGWIIGGSGGGGARAIVLTNQKGAVLELSGRQVGLMANADLSGLAITLR